MDHSKVTYDDFRKFFYKEAPEVKAMGANELMILQKQLEVKVSGFDCPNPVRASCMTASCRMIGYHGRSQLLSNSN